VDFSLTEEQGEIAALAERILSDLATPDRVGQVETTAERFDRELWSTLAGAGLLGLAVPEEHGGGGLGLIELCLLLEQQGRRVAPVPLLATLVCGALPLARFGTPDQCSRWLPGVASGQVVLTAALNDATSRDPMRPSVEARPTDSGWQLRGSRVAVPAAHLASRIVVPAASDSGAVALFLVDPAAAGVTVERAETTDREVAPHLHLDGTVVAAEDLLVGFEDGSEALRLLLDWATVGVCALQVGVTEEAVRTVAGYTAQRRQFGKPLSTFQGVALRAADAYIEAEAIRVTMWQAAWRLAEGLDARAAVEVAKWWAAYGGHRVVHAAQHLHGGLGADIEYPAHRYFLWGKQLELTLGGASETLARLGDTLATTT
jgi:acyl-CoA dehydrogenase